MNRIFIFFFLAIFITACNNDNDPEVIVDIEPEFRIDLWEELTVNGRTLQVLIETIKEQDCLNYSIGISRSQSNNIIRIEIRDILSPNTCIDGTAPAKAVVGLWPLNLQKYPFELSLLKGTIPNLGELEVNPQRYRLDLHTHNGIELMHTELEKVPPQFVWGYLAYNDDALLDDAMQLYSQFTAFGSAVQLEEGYYGYFSVENNKISVYPSPDSPFVNTFFFNYNGDKQSLTDLADQHRNSPDNEFEIRLFTSEGEEL